MCSRNSVAKLVREGRVLLNGKLCKRANARVMADTDKIVVDGQVVGKQPTRLWRYHKPPGLLCTHSDPQGRRTVFDDLRERFDWLPRIVSVGRLDAQTEGLLLLTTSPSLARQLEEPANGHVRHYVAKLRRPELEAEIGGMKAEGEPKHESTVSDAMRRELHAGLCLSNGTTFGPILVDILDRQPAVLGRAEGGEASERLVSVRVTEGKKHEVRRAFHHFGFRVPRLVRVAFGPFELGSLPPGQVEEVDAAEAHAMVWRRRSSSAPAGHTGAG